MVYRDEIKYFEKNISKDRRYLFKFKKLISKLNTNSEKIESIKQSIANYNYQLELNHCPSSEGLRFIILCSAIECFYKFRLNTIGDSKVTFKNFLKNITKKYKTQICKGIIIKDKTKNKVIRKLDTKYDLFKEYIYHKRCNFVHEGVNFSFSKGCNFIDGFKIKEGKEIRNYIIELLFTIDDFDRLYLHCLINNLNELKSI